jgi:hypothetical protein
LGAAIQKNQYHDAMLWAQSAISIPHVTPPGAIGPAAVNVDISFYPDGQYYSSTLLYNRPDFTLDGFPFLMEGFRLNGTWETQLIGAETPKWNANATAIDPPSNNWFLRGFVELRGPVVAPYFGPLQGPIGHAPQRLCVGLGKLRGSYRRCAEKCWVE